ncbi:SDR family NAD(P)-dependent oxidoreductase [Shewanella woodyi]|uniref:SDR family NAD(P)-dependent oxidoreductase n=1 Tax=Shewanella woodyi TaxID=60961 RepID=UPI003747D210
MLKGKTILITGAAGLLGSQVTCAILAQGATVIATDLSISAMTARLSEIRTIESDPLTLVELDSSDEEAVKHFSQLRSKFLAPLIVLTHAINSMAPHF